MKCTCPLKTDDHTRAIVRANTDQLCPVHGQRRQELPHCATCACGEVPIVQTPEIAAQRVAERDEQAE